MDNNKLINSAYIAGSSKYKQLGFSLLYEGERVSKADPCMAVSSLQEHVRLLVSRILKQANDGYLFLNLERTNYLVDVVDLEFLEWLQKNIFSLSSFVYLKGNTDFHVIPESAIDFIAERKEHFKSQVNPKINFVYQSDEFLLLLDELRIWVRDLERAYIGYHYDSRSVSSRETLFAKALEDNDSKVSLQSVINLYINSFRTAQFLNLLSDYLFYLIRYEAKKRQLPEIEWQSCGQHIEDFIGG